MATAMANTPVLKWVGNKRFKVGPIIGSGSFGIIYKGISFFVLHLLLVLLTKIIIISFSFQGTTFATKEEVAIKLEHVSTKYPQSTKP